MKSHNEDVRKSIEETSPIFQAARRANVALQIRSKMHEKGLKNRDIAERLGVSEANISRWLRGNQNLSVDTIYQLADALEESVEIVVGATDVAPTEQVAVSRCVGLDDWDARRELEADAAALDDGFASTVCGGKIYSFESYRSLQRTGGGAVAFADARSEIGIHVREEERMYK